MPLPLQAAMGGGSASFRVLAACIVNCPDFMSSQRSSQRRSTAKAHATGGLRCLLGFARSEQASEYDIT